MKATSIRTIAEIMRFWPFFKEGATSLNALVDVPYTEEAWFRLITDVALNPDEGMGQVIVVLDKDEPVFFLVAFNNQNVYKERKTAFIHGAYSNGQAKGSSSFGLTHLEKWAKKHEYVELQTNTPRLGGSVRRLFKRSFGFDWKGQFFTKPL